MYHPGDLPRRTRLPPEGPPAPLLGDILRASLQEASLDITHDSISAGRTRRIIFPFGIVAADGFWYCACYDYGKRQKVTLRVDRVFSIRLREHVDKPEPIALSESFSEREEGQERSVIRLRGSNRGLKNFGLQPLLDRIKRRERYDSHEVIETDIVTPHACPRLT